MNRAIAIARITMMALIMSALIATLTDTSGRVPSSLAETATYFTFQANLIALIAWGALVFYARRGGPRPRWLEYGRAFTAANLVAIGAIYWIAIAPLGMEDGPQLVYVMIISHCVTPIYAAVEQLLVGPRTPLPWRHLWIIAGYASVWVSIAVVRSLFGVTPVYDYLDPALGGLAVGTGLLWNFAVLAIAGAGAMRIRRWRRWPDTGNWSAHHSAEAHVAVDDELEPVVTAGVLRTPR
ncbi:hypothetical protein [Demequina aurantiaca]|uniref:hypothetical protein n=1 Tax=Demequina aurantiaca TaxID=676200 RepID=UPI003D355906